jgi:hypothetical protein
VMMTTMTMMMMMVMMMMMMMMMTMMVVVVVVMTMMTTTTMSCQQQLHALGRLKSAALYRTTGRAGLPETRASARSNSPPPLLQHPVV